MRPLESWVSHIQQSGLSAIAARYLWRGLAPSIRCSYDTPRLRFTVFCTLSNLHYLNCGFFPAQATWLIEWLCSLAENVKVKTMKLYLAGIKSYQLDLGIDCSAFTDPQLEWTIQDIKRDYCKTDCRTRGPLTRPYHLQILRCLTIPIYDNIVLQAAFTLAFAGFLRVGEFTYKEVDKELGPTFVPWFLTNSSIWITEAATRMEVTLPSSKTDPFRKSIKLSIAASNDTGCQVEVMRRLLRVDTHRHPLTPLFCNGRHEQRAFTREYVVAKLHELARHARLGYGLWNSHSFRRGAATWAAEVGNSEAEIQTPGCWRSDAYKAYIEYSQKSKSPSPVASKLPRMCIPTQHRLPVLGDEMGAT